MEEPADKNKLIGDLLIAILKGRQDLADEIEEYKFDAAIGKFVREFEHIKGDMLSFICKCFISRGLNETYDKMVMYLLKDLKVGSIQPYLGPMYQCVNPVDQTGHKGLESFSKNIGILNTNRNMLIHQYHLEMKGTMNDTGKKVTGRFSFSAKPSPDGPTLKGVIYKTTAIEENIQYVKDVQHCLEQCCERIATQEAVSDLLNEFNQRPVPSMGKIMNIPPCFPLKIRILLHLPICSFDEQCS